jgi:predicted DNA-binding transcriptional regulator AlpA
VSQITEPAVRLAPVADGESTCTDAVAPLRDRPEAVRPSSLAAVAEPMLIPAAVACVMCGRSEASWWRDHAAKRVPAPVKLGGRTLWRTDELRRWVAAGCPSRLVWGVLEKAQRR